MCTLTCEGSSGLEGHATLRPLGFYLRCFNGFENCYVGSEIHHHGIEACVAAYE